MTVKFTDADGKVVYTDAPHKLETGAYDDEPEMRPWVNLWLGVCVPGVEKDDFGDAIRVEQFWAPVRVEVL